MALGLVFTPCMLRTWLSILTAVATPFSVASWAAAAGPHQVCSQFESLRRSNCEEAFRLIPNPTALDYSIKYLIANSGSLQDPSCLKGGQGLASKGIRNTCSFVLNDLESQYKGNPLRANAYYINLCAPNPRQVVTRFYVNKGSGTKRADYADREGAHSSNAGAYLTGTKVVEFIPYHLSAAYRSLRKTLGGFIPALDLYGLHTTNNNTSDSKPMHASPYQSSWGCPSVSPAATGIMRTLAKYGPSLVMNYGPTRFHPESSLTSCRAVPERSAGRRTPKTASRRRHGRYYVNYALHRHHRPGGNHGSRGAR